VTLAPNWASSIAQARPIPWLLPHTNALIEAKLISIIDLIIVNVTIKNKDELMSESTIKLTSKLAI
jgi:hypothetical protein